MDKDTLRGILLLQKKVTRLLNPKKVSTPLIISLSVLFLLIVFGLPTYYEENLTFSKSIFGFLTAFLLLLVLYCFSLSIYFFGRAGDILWPTDEKTITVKPVHLSKKEKLKAYNYLLICAVFLITLIILYRSFLYFLEFLD